jgi:hypothetical protein
MKTHLFKGNVSRVSYVVANARGLVLIANCRKLQRHCHGNIAVHEKLCCKGDLICFTIKVNNKFTTIHIYNWNTFLSEIPHEGAYSVLNCLLRKPV